MGRKRYPKAVLFYSGDVLDIIGRELMGKDKNKFTPTEHKYARVRDVIKANPDLAGLYPRQMGGFLKADYKNFKILWDKYRKKTLDISCQRG